MNPKEKNLNNSTFLKAIFCLFTLKYFLKHTFITCIWWGFFISNTGNSPVRRPHDQVPIDIPLGTTAMWPSKES